MGRTRKDKSLPVNLHKKHGAYYYVCTINGKKNWTHLGKDEKKAIERANEINDLRRKEKIRAFGIARHANSYIKSLVLERDEYKCTYCGATEDLGLDHAIPYIKGGSDQPFNLVTCCVDCNYKKNDMNPILFILKQQGIFEKILQSAIEFVRQDKAIIDKQQNIGICK